MMWVVSSSMLPRKVHEAHPHLWRSVRVLLLCLRPVGVGDSTIGVSSKWELRRGSSSLGAASKVDDSIIGTGSLSGIGALAIGASSRSGSSKVGKSSGIDGLALDSSSTIGVSWATSASSTVGDSTHGALDVNID
jgi:hypothetical protein